MNTNEALEKLDRATGAYQAARAKHDDARTVAVNAAMAALRAGATPTEVSSRSPYTAAHVRKLARQHGIHAKGR